MVTEALTQSWKSSCSGQPVPALSQGFLTWWGKNQISKGDSSQLTSLDFKCSQGQATLVEQRVQIRVGTRRLTFCYNVLDFHNFTWMLLHNSGQLFPAIACLELTCLRNDFSRSSQQILSQPHLAEIPELCHTFMRSCHLDCVPSRLCRHHGLRSAH